MAHPQQFDDEDPLLAKLREICLALPGADEKVSHGRPAFFTKKIFAIFGAVVKGDHYTDTYSQALIFMPDPDEAQAVDHDERFFVPAYWGPSGWRGLDLRDAGKSKVDWDEVAELVADSFRATAGKRLIAELDAAS